MAEPTIIENAWELDWIPLDTARDGNVPGPCWKVLFTDPASGAMTFLMHLPPNWNDKLLDYHPSTEEAYVIEGRVTLGGHPLDKGNYMYRPPYILHGPVRITAMAGFTALQRTDSELRILRYTDDEFPHVHLQPVRDDYKTWPVKWDERIDVEGILFEDVTEGGWAGTRLKWIFKHENGGGCVMVDVPEGWSGTGSAGRGPVEEFVLEGDLTAGGTDFGLWGYAQRPAGQPAGEYASARGARLICYWNGADER